jgi:hypothetical protein
MLLYRNISKITITEEISNPKIDTLLTHIIFYAWPLTFLAWYTYFKKSGVAKIVFGPFNKTKNKIYYILGIKFISQRIMV